MKRILSILITLCSLFPLFFLGSCGDGPGSPGSQGSDNTGVVPELFMTPTYLDSNTKSVDVVQQICDPGPPPEFEPFADHQAVLTVTAKLINENPQIPPGTLFIEKYTVEYRRAQDSIGTPPIESDTRFDTIVITPPQSGAGSTSTSATVIFVDLKRKDKYLIDMETGQFTSGLALINNYTATYTFEGKNQYGERFVWTAQTDFQIGSFDYCD